ncbi:two-component system, chemotaxis family, response regulator CheV [Tindallia magadiensis]|uniref:Stage 0 sporulation protein A homolog n=1 Tax=Tindallia magadiensis TaxID=69895 RepID=A0A1I3HA47_9FIRM|nr:chemotaxis protein [Tindallia magadiensis]SFI32616.1 two-component system, chemotaxis family, response regulator CheV [Tindallia magadiensis]
MDKQKGILLESGTNELEIVEFRIGENYFGINVAKVKEIIPFTKPTSIPNSHPCIRGIFKPRDEVITAVDLPRYLNFPEEKSDQARYIISHFNQITVGFLVDAVVGIHRISWEKVEKPDETIFSGHEGIATGIVKLEEKLIVVLDFEKILADISPNTGIQVADVSKLGPRNRSEKPILIAEDSKMLANMLLDSLHAAGYTFVTVMPNGKEAWDMLEAIKKDKSKPWKERVSLLITDIEMPRMDGHSLTKKVKDDEDLQELPIIIFSSLIDDQMRRKGEALGANDQISKPEINRLVETIDRLIL